MVKFKNLAQMQAWLEKNVHQVVNKSAEIERILVDAMVESVWMNVYDAYEPQQYNRREDEGGLADERNYEVTSVSLVDGRVRMVVENLTQGNDNLSHTFLSDTIEAGIKSNWNNSNGSWAEARPYIAETIKKLKENPEELAGTLRKGLAAKGLKIQ
ncbi:hypothetical protein [Sporosarcina sp. FSL W7-1283]|uniref:hypothetical protein n=1 Tax=Sporosarcina sp. FSL W7-1283 TaxID=2921560 RepID=UPI0030F96D65